jgi:hypothetical protein
MCWPGLLITNTRAEMGGRTFAMANITAVSMGTADPAPAGCPITLLIVGAVSALIGIPTLTSFGGIFLAIGIAAFVGGSVWWKERKPSYSVNISSASGESRAMQSQNREEIEAIVTVECPRTFYTDLNRFICKM